MFTPSPDFNRQSLQITGFRYSQNFRMMGRLIQPLPDDELPSSIGGSFLQHAFETRPIDIVGTGEGDQDATWTKQL